MLDQPFNVICVAVFAQLSIVLTIRFVKFLRVIYNKKWKFVLLVESQILLYATSRKSMLGDSGKKYMNLNFPQNMGWANE